MGKIQVLDDLTIQKIAAGEVIERPSSIVKELIENSLDANARNIVIEIEKGGKDLIRITDDGDGISKEDLKLAFKRHSTSKLRSIDDIYKVLSLGFRGEALASIASVARVEVLTKSDDSNSGIQAFVEDATINSINKVGCPKGTTMIVRDLFYNLPVRKNFLKTDQTEANHINNLINNLAIGNPHVSFRFIRDNKSVLKTSRSNNLREIVHTVLGRDYSKNLLDIHYHDDYIDIEGLISNNNLYRGNRSHQYLFINNRYIINYNISRLVEQIYRTLIPNGKYPVFILNIKIDPSEIDINIHPTKQEIKFINSDMVFNKIEKLIRSRMNSIMNIPTMSIGNNNSLEIKDEVPLFNLSNESETSNIIVHDLTNLNYEDFDSHIDKAYNPVEDKSEFTNIKEIKKDFKEEAYEEKDLFSHMPRDIVVLGVVFNTYIILELKNENKVIFIDQHAAHERVMYERYKKEFEREEVNSQMLLAAELIELTNLELENVLDNIDLFEKLGFEIEEFGPNSIAIRSVPLIFGQPQIKRTFLDIVDSLSDNIKSNYDTRIDKIMKIACTNAIKSGDRLDDIEIKKLFNDLMECQTPHTCPHGRPTIVELTKKDIEKQFLRIN